MSREVRHLPLSEENTEPPKHSVLSLGSGECVVEPALSSEPMKFAERYEIQEMVTSGRVSTFIARDCNSQEPVVVYTFEVTGTPSADLNTASIIGKFATLAPIPAGIILKAGFDEASSSAFITTKMLDSAVLQQWVGAYHNFVKTATPPPSPPVPKPAAPPSNETTELS